MAFTSHIDASFDVCFTNQLTGGTIRINSEKNHQYTNNFTAVSVSKPSRHIELTIDIGADAKDWTAVQTTEKLKPVETELRRIEETVGEIVAEMEYLRSREQKLRDTNESTNTRVKWFAFSSMGMLISLGIWQIFYLRAYFRYDTCRKLDLSTNFFIKVKASYLENMSSTWSNSGIQYKNSDSFYDFSWLVTLSD